MFNVVYVFCWYVVGRNENNLGDTDESESKFATSLGLGTTQVILTTVAGMAVAHALGISWEGSIIVGGAIALSSTAIVAKQLTEQLEMQSRHGRLALGALLFQDIAVVPFLVIIPILAGGESDMTNELTFAVAKAVAAFIIMSALGRWVLRPVFHTVASAHSAELFTLTVGACPST